MQERSVSASELREKILVKGHVDYSLSDKGKRLLEISENLSDDEAKAFLVISPRQLDTLRAILKEGSKGPRDFPYDARYAIKKMVERGFLERHICFDVEELKRPARRSIDLWISRRNRLCRLLEKNGPMPKREAMKTLGLNGGQVKMIRTIFPEDFQTLRFVAGRARRRREGFYHLFKVSPVLTLKGDPRIVDFAASKISLKVKTGYDAKVVFELLKWQLGYQQARAVVEKLGYRYKS